MNRILAPLALIAAALNFFVLTAPRPVQSREILPRAERLLGQARYATADRAVFAHSHNDYERATPLFSALRRGFESVEADVWLRRNRLLVSHSGFSHSGSLERLYLRPLQALIDRRGSVHGDGRPFYLWIDIKHGHPRVAGRLHSVLKRYPMLTRYGPDGKVMPAPVVVILTGDAETKREYADRAGVRFAARDSNQFRAADPPADSRWSWYSLDWTDHFNWRGDGLLPESERSRLRSLVEAVHAKGRRLRFWNTPDRPAVWKALAGAGVDFIGTDRPERFDISRRPASAE